jgi:hypothetical protein
MIEPDETIGGYIGAILLVWAAIFIVNWWVDTMYYQGSM